MQKHARRCTCTRTQTLLTHIFTYRTAKHTHVHNHTYTRQGSAVWLINSFLCWGGVMTADSSQSPEDQRVTPLINWARWNVKHWIWSSLPLSAHLSPPTHSLVFCEMLLTSLSSSLRFWLSLWTSFSGSLFLRFSSKFLARSLVHLTLNPRLSLSFISLSHCYST